MPRRSIDTAVWADHRFTDLSADAKLVFFRLVTGDDMGPSGAMRVSTRRIASDMCMSQKRAAAGLADLVDSGIARAYDDGWYWLPAWIKHQVTGVQFCRAVRRHARDCPDSLQRAIGRALDAHAPRQGSDKPRTRNVATSRDKGRPSPRPSADPHPTLREKDQDQDQDSYPFGVKSPSGTSSSSARPTPPSPNGNGITPLTDAQRSEAQALIDRMRAGLATSHQDDPERRRRVERFRAEAQERALGGAA